MSPGEPQDVEAATPLLTKVLIIVGIIAVLITIGGIIGIIWNAVSPTQISILGMNVSTGSVGVAFVALGVIMVIVIYRAVLKNISELAKLP